MAKEPIISGKHLRELRKKTGVKQKAFSQLADIPIDSLRAYENNRRLLKLSKFREIKGKLGYSLENSKKLRVMIDYLRITFKEVKDLDFFCRKYLLCDLKEFTSEETRLMKYTHLWRRGDIWIFDFAEKTLKNNYQITLQLSGAGCRQFELIMERENTTWIEVLQKMYFDREDMKVTRIDIALDELYQGQEKEDQHFLLSDMIAKVYHDEIKFDRLKNWNHIGGGQLRKKEDVVEASQGISIYFGSRQSNLYFNFYEKRYELARKENMTVAESLEVFGIWNRYEIRFSQEKAHGLIEEYVSGVDIAELALGVVNKEIQVYTGLDKYGAYLPDQKWQALFGGVEPLKLSVKPEPYSLERTIRWLLYQVADTLHLVSEADKKMASSYLEMILNSGQLSERGEKILEQLKPDDVHVVNDFLEGVS